MEITTHGKRTDPPLFSVNSLSLPVMNGADEEADKPAEGVLVHGVDVGQVGDAEEEHGRVLRHGPVRLPRLRDLQLRLLCDLHASTRGETAALIGLLILIFHKNITA